MSLRLIVFFSIISNFCNSIIDEADNIARNRPSYQSTTSANSRIASKANDNANGFSHWSHTYAKEDWWLIDLGNYYHVTEICFLNRLQVGKKIIFYLIKITQFTHAKFFFHQVHHSAISESIQDMIFLTKNFSVRIIQVRFLKQQTQTLQAMNV